jgi:hypothetical protein
MSAVPCHAASRSTLDMARHGSFLAGGALDCAHVRFARRLEASNTELCQCGNRFDNQRRI